MNKLPLEESGESEIIMKSLVELQESIMFINNKMREIEKKKKRAFRKKTKYKLQNELNSYVETKSWLEDLQKIYNVNLARLKKHE